MNLLSVWLVLLALLVSGGLILLFRQLRRSLITSRQRTGVQQLMLIKQLLVLTQRHRGASYGAIKGDTQLRTTVAELERAMEQQIRQLSPLADAGRQQDHWLAFADHWSRLQRNNLSTDAENNLAQHNQLIGVLLYLLEDVAESSWLTEAGQEPMTWLWRDLPRAAELVGQARVLGSGIMAEGTTDSVHKIRMRFVRSRLEQVMTEQARGNEKLQELMTVIDQQILQESAQRMGAKAYFDLSTQAMEPFFQRIDDGLKRLQQLTGAH
ncbi:hypothetical protein ACQUQU_17790 [Thalassolituus sp. LLYu03]|uniref:hypothetical protein n=1 Tax=Thalassolituus sp. LLYu03 TaxID=3421656 RepID=UPI003D2C1014